MLSEKSEADNVFSKFDKLAANGINVNENINNVLMFTIEGVTYFIFSKVRKWVVQYLLINQKDRI